jgi:hypothetical protein
VSRGWLKWTPDLGPVHGEFVNYGGIGIWNRPRQWPPSVVVKDGMGGHNAYSARAHEFGNGGQQVDGEYEQVKSSTWTVA